MTTLAPVAPEVKVAGAPLPAAWQRALVELRVDLGLRAVGTVTLRFADPGYALAAQSIFGAGSEVTVSVVGAGALATADVTGVAIEQREGMPPELTVTAHDAAHRLTSASSVRSFQAMNSSDVFRKVTSLAGLKARIAASSDVHEHLLQAGTDLDFLNDLADRLGWDWAVDGDLFVAGPPGTGAAVRCELGSDLREFSVRASGRHPQSVQVTGWSRERKTGLRSTVEKVGPTAVASTSQLVEAFVRTAAPLRARPTVAARSVASENEAKSMARAARDRLVSAAVLARGRGPVDRRLRPGVRLTVANAGPASGTYHVTQVEHIYRRTGFETRFVAGDRAPTTLVDTIGQSRGEATGSYQGLMVGIVTNNLDPEKQGRVRVRFPNLSSDEESSWARLAVVGGGAGRGMVSVPEVNDEVLVGFEGGDLRFPVVLGGLFGGKDKAPEYAAGAGVAHRRITSRTGDFIELGDGSGTQGAHVMIVLNGAEHKLRLGKDAMDIELPERVPFTVRAGRSSMAIDAAGNITLSGENIDIKARQNVRINGHTVATKATTELKAEGAFVVVKAQGTAMIEGQGVVTVKGAAVKIN